MRDLALLFTIKIYIQVFHLKPALLHVEIKKGFLITRAQKCLDSQGSHFQHLL